MMTDQLLASIYYNPSHPASFSSVKKLHEAAKEKTNVSYSEVKNWLKGELAYTLHFPARRKFKRNRIIVNHLNQQWEADLVDLKEFDKFNDYYKYILTIIDVLSKYAFAVPLKVKSGNALENAFKQVFSKRKCSFLRTDKGKEFLNKDVLSLLKSLNIQHFTSNNEDVKCAIVERFNRTSKSKMFKYFTAHGTKRYIDKLQNFVDAYNNSLHRSIKMRPTEVTSDNEHIAFKNLYGASYTRELLNESINHKILSVGDKVRKNLLLDH